MTQRIAMINLTTGTKHGGVETFVIELSKNLALRGFEVDLYVGDGSIALDLGEHINIFRLPYTPRERILDLGSRFRKFGERLSFAFHAWPTFKSRRYDYLYVHKPYDLPLALFYRYRRGGKVIYSSHGTEFFRGYKKLVSTCDLRLACSHFNAQQVYDYCGLRPEVLYNGVNTELFRPMAPDEELRKKLGIVKGECVLFTAARLIGLKGIQYGLAAMAKSRHREKLRYLIAGEGDYRSDLEKKIRELDLGNQVQFIGMLPNEELPRYYSITDIALYPSVADETFGISIAEAMSTDTPVITCNVGGIPEVVGEDSILVPPRSPDRIAAEIDHILDGGFKGEPRRRITDNFNWQKITDHFLQLLEAPQD
jgi:glycosyltransferase involved in cell wall biosynthesis